MTAKQDRLWVISRSEDWARKGYLGVNWDRTILSTNLKKKKKNQIGGLTFSDFKANNKRTSIMTMLDI
jgi:hypothetical protein